MTHLAAQAPAVARGGRSRVPVADITLAFTTVFTAALIAIVAAFVFVPEVRPWLAASDGLISWTTRATLGLAVATGVWAYRRSTTESRFRMLIPSAAAVLFLQSIRFATSALHIQLPEVSGLPVGSLLDLRAVTSLNAERLGLGWAIGALILVLIGLVSAWIAAIAWKWARDRVRVTETAVVVYFVSALAIESAVPVLGFFGESTGAWFATVMASLVGAGLLVVAGLASGDHRTTVAGWRRRMKPWIGEESGASALPHQQR
jgi:hypothetical protein